MRTMQGLCLDSTRTRTNCRRGSSHEAWLHCAGSPSPSALPPFVGASYPAHHKLTQLKNRLKIVVRLRATMGDEVMRGMEEPRELKRSVS